MRERVVITGIGCVSCFGVGAGAFISAIRSGDSGVRPITSFDTSNARAKTAATVQGFDPAAFIAPLKLRRVDEAGRIALACAKLALDDAGWSSGASRDDIGVAMGTFTAGLDSTVAYLRGLAKDGPAGVPAILFSNTVQNAAASLCAIEYGLRGPNVTFNQREASSLAAIAFAAASIRDARAPAMIAGSTDWLEPMFFRVHDRLHALSPMHAGEEEAARPFDRRRNGYVFGDGGFLLVLESAASAERRGARTYGELLAVSSGAAPTALNQWPRDASGLARTMHQAIDDAGLTASDISAVIATANGSPALDAIEAEAIRAVLPPRVPVASFKGAIGESSGGGAASIVGGLGCLAAGTLPGTVGFAQPDPACDVNVAAAARAASGPVFLVNSVASGGTIHSAVVRCA
jgi:3-oxoacyl-[acyl-carrier-protein] synthase II